MSTVNINLSITDGRAFIKVVWLGKALTNVKLWLLAEGVPSSTITLPFNFWRNSDLLNQKHFFSLNNDWTKKSLKVIYWIFFKKTKKISERFMLKIFDKLTKSPSKTFSPEDYTHKFLHLFCIKLLQSWYFALQSTSRDTEPALSPKAFNCSRYFLLFLLKSTI